MPQQPYLQIKNTIQYDVPPDFAFEFTSQGKADITKIMQRTGPIPGIASHKLLTEHWGQVGSARLNTMDDGTSATDRITLVDRAERHFQYEVVDITFSLKHLVNKARGDWYFLPTADGKTQVEWYYGFEPKFFLAQLPLFIMLHTLIRQYLHNALQRTKVLIEAQYQK